MAFKNALVRRTSALFNISSSLTGRPGGRRQWPSLGEHMDAVINGAVPSAGVAAVATSSSTATTHAFFFQNPRCAFPTTLASHVFPATVFSRYQASQAYATLPGSTGRLIGKAPLQASASERAQKKSQETLMYLAALVIAMVACSYAAVPLYRKFCQATGYGGTVRRRETVEEKIARHAQDDVAAKRELVVQFNADVADGLPWRFMPTQREVRVKPGQSTLAFYTAENLSSKAIVGVSTYNVSPMKAGSYFNKIQCFCFEEQRLLPGEKVDMPVFFYIDPEFATDPKMDGINNLILSYTFFKVEDDEGLPAAAANGK